VNHGESRPDASIDVEPETRESGASEVERERGAWGRIILPTDFGGSNARSRVTLVQSSVGPEKVEESNGELRSKTPILILSSVFPDAFAARRVQGTESFNPGIGICRGYEVSSGIDLAGPLGKRSRWVIKRWMCCEVGRRMDEYSLCCLSEECWLGMKRETGRQHEIRSDSKVPDMAPKVIKRSLEHQEGIKTSQTSLDSSESSDHSNSSHLFRLALIPPRKLGSIRSPWQQPTSPSQASPQPVNPSASPAC